MNVSIANARSRCRLAAPVLLTLLVWAPVAAQSTSELVNPSSISFEHDGRNVTGFVAYIATESGPPLRVDLGAIRPDKGKIVARIPALSPGTYSLAVAAYNPAGESARVRAVPARFRVTESAALTKAEPRPDQSAVPAADLKKSEQPAKSKRSFLGKVYGVVVGSDEEDTK